MKKLVLVVLSLIPLLAGVLIVQAIPVSVNVTFNKSADSIKTVKKDLFGLAKESDQKKLSSYKEAYLADPSAYYINFLPAEGTMYPITLTGNWFGNKELLRGYVNRINDFLGSYENEMSIDIPLSNPGRTEGILLLICLPLALISLACLGKVISSRNG